MLSHVAVRCCVVLCWGWWWYGSTRSKQTGGLCCLPFPFCRQPQREPRSLLVRKSPIVSCEAVWRALPCTRAGECVCLLYVRGGRRNEQNQRKQNREKSYGVTIKNWMPTNYHTIPVPPYHTTLSPLHYLNPQHSQHNIYSKTMPWPFCPNCRATLKVDSSGQINCDMCGYCSNLAELHELPSRTTYSMPRPTPIWAKSDEEQQALRQSKEPVRATIEEPCVKCGHAEVGYYTVQLRSVDEGQTVFYECPSCKHTWSINN